MQAYGAALDKHRLERLNAKPVQRGRAVEQHRPVFDHILEDVPNFGTLAFGEALGALDVVRVAVENEAVHHERLEQLQRHLARQTALMKLQLRPHDDDGAPAVVHALAQQVLAEAPLLAAQQIGQRLELMVMAARHRPAAPAVIY